MKKKMVFRLTEKERNGSDDSGNDDSGSDSNDSDYAGNSDSGGPANKRKRKHLRKKNKNQKATAKKQKRTTRKNQNQATRAAACAAPAAASAAANDGYPVRRLRHRRPLPLRAVGSAPRVVQASGGTGFGSRPAAHLVERDAGQQETARLERLPIRD